MKFRIAKKIIFSRHWSAKLEKIDRYKPYYNEQGHYTVPPIHTHPVKSKA